MKRVWICTLLLTAFVRLQGQDPSPFEKAQALESLSMGNMTFRSFSPGLGADGIVKGSIKLFDRYQPGLIRFKNRDISNDQIDFDAYAHDILVLRAGQELVLDKSVILGFSIISLTGDSIVFERHKDEEGRYVFDEVLERGRHGTLFRRYSKRLLKPSAGGPYDPGRDFAEIVTKEEFLCSSKSNGPVAIRRKKDLFRAFPGYADRIQKFIAREDLGIKSTDDLKLIFSHLNSL